MQAGLLVLALPAAAQIKTGDFSTSLSGIVTTGYTADYGNQTSSDHSWTVGGDASASGSFYSPNFLSYSASLYLNQSRANSDFQSISNTSGVIANATVFGGSHFPGSIGYSKSYDGEGSYDVPGVTNYVTHGNSDAFGISWSESLPDLPSLSASFQVGGSQYSVYGSNDDGETAFHSVNLHSNYRLTGFNMAAFYSSGGGHSLIPEVVSGEAGTETHSDDSGYGFNVSHRLPLNGTFSATATRSNFGNEYQGTSTTGSIDLVDILAAVQPTSKLNIQASANYSDNLSGQLDQSIIAVGGVVTGDNTNGSSDSVDLMAVASYALEANLGTSAFVERRIQDYQGENYGETSYGGGANYGHKLFAGNFNAALFITGNVANQDGSDNLGLSTTENFSDEIRGWKVNGSFGYEQNVETLLVTDMNSMFYYSGNVTRRWGNFIVSAGAGASKTALTEEAGTSNSSLSYNGSVGFSPFFTASGSYSKSSGEALETGTGLVPVTGPIPASTLVSLYGGNGYSFAISSSPARGLLMSASYSKSTSNLSSAAATSLNDTDEYNALIQYQARKLNFTSGYSRLGQGFSGSGTPAEVISSFYIGVSRWFNFF